MDATVNGNGGGGNPVSQNAGADDAVIDHSTGAPVPVSIDTQTSTIAANRDYATPIYAALRADRPFRAASSGYAGTASDGLVQLDTDRHLSATYATATDGNVVQIAKVDARANHPFTLALGFDTDQREPSARLVALPRRSSSTCAGTTPMAGSTTSTASADQATRLA